MKKLFFVIGFLLLFGNAYSQYNLVWYRNQQNLFHLNENPSNKSLTIDSLENIYTVYYSIDSANIVQLITTKYSYSGEHIWSRTHGIKIGSGIGDYPCLIKKLHNNKIAVLYNFIDENNHNKIGLLIYDADGLLIYNTKYKINSNEDSFVNQFDIDKSDNIYITGYSNGGYSKFITLKFNSSCNLLWEKIFAEPSQGFDIVTDSLGNVYICGAADTNSLLKTYMMTVKYDNSGVLKWRKFYGYQNSGVSGLDQATQIKLDDSLNVIIGGSCFTNSYFQTLAKYKPNGELCWVKLNTSMMGTCNITTDSKCNIYVSGYREGLPGYILKYSPGGILKTTFSSSTDYVHIIKYFKGKYLYSAGNKLRGTITQRDFYFSLLDTNLNTVESHTLSIDSSTSNHYSSMEVDLKGNVFLSGVCYYENIYPPHYEFTTVKLSQPVGIQNISNKIPDRYSLSQNYPNPFNPNTIIRFQIKGMSSPHVLGGDLITLKIYDILGKEVATPVNEKLQPGEYEVTFDGSGLTSGIYFYRLTCGDFTQTKRMLLIK
ncbi:MAG: T9SS type A sorting domain-containing protein [Ignavibacteria bacterium]|jgi:hypothetical protein